MAASGTSDESGAPVNAHTATDPGLDDVLRDARVHDH
jgi:hypothetical protein